MPVKALVSVVTVIFTTYFAYLSLFWIMIGFPFILDKSITPGRSGSGDRFIPNRSASQIELGQFLVSNAGRPSDEASLSPSRLQMQKAMSENLNGDLTNAKIMAYHQKPPAMPEGQYSLLLNQA